MPLSNRGLAAAASLVLVALVATASCTLSVYNLQALGESNEALLDIKYSIANFGFVPYGKTIVARLMASPSFSNECSLDPNEHASFENSFLLIPRGECEFVTKALNAQRLGAQMAIIMDDKQHEKMVIMTDNSYGYKVKIPSIFIHHNDGQLLKELVEDAEGAAVMMKISFTNQKTEKVDLTFWLQANNRHSYRLVEDFRHHYPLISDSLNFHVVYSNVPCPQCREEDCYFGRAYCASNLIHEQGATGRLVLDQQLREEIALELYPQQWWNFMKYVDDHCSVISELKECSAAAMQDVGMDAAEVESRLGESFGKDGDNAVLKRSREILANAGVTRLPAVTINGAKVKGSLKAEFIFDDVCNTLLRPPGACARYVSSEVAVVREVSNQWATLLLVVSVSVVAFSLIFVAYRRHMKRKISSEMQSRVDETVSKYVEFYSERRK